MSAKNQPSEITLDRNKTFSFLSIGNYVNSEQLLNEIAETVRRLVESGKDTMLVRWSYGLERIVSDCFLALRDEFPKLRTIKVTYSEDSCQGISKHADGLVISLDINNTRKLSIEDFMFQNSSTIICHISYSLYKKSKLKKYAQQIGNLEVINLFTPILQNAREKELYRLIDTGEHTPEEIAARILDWNPNIPYVVSNKTREFQKVLETVALQYADEADKIKEISPKLFSSLFYYAYLIGYREAKEE